MAGKNMQSNLDQENSLCRIYVSGNSHNCPNVAYSYLTLGFHFLNFARPTFPFFEEATKSGLKSLNTHKMNTPFYTLDELVQLKQAGHLRQETDFTRKNEETKQKSGAYRDVHVYDGQLAPVESLAQICYPPELKLQLLHKLLYLLTNPVSKDMAVKIMQEQVYDGANKIQTDNLFADILSRRMSIDIFFLLEDQLADNFMLGQCPMGRSHRLMQIRRMV